MAARIGQRLTLLGKLGRINWLIVLVICAIAGAGIGVLYSVADGSFDPWATRQAIRFGFALALMLGIALVDIRIWMRMAFPLYGLGLILLVAVELFGVAGGGGQRWIDLKFMRLQPSELMKVALILILARYYHGLTLEKSKRLSSLIEPVLLMLLPVALVVRQPDLGTSLLLMAGGITMIFLSGMRMWLFIAGGTAALAAIPIGWQFLRDYQKDRVLTFLDPSRDPLGAGYHITQSKIALGSGGLSGKGYLQGTQSHLNFLPEMHTDFIFTMLAEEWGLIGGLILLSAYMIVLIYGVVVSMRARSQFGRMLAMGLSMTVFLYIFINVAMVMGLLPVVGVPLPLVSYGGSATMTVMIAFGLILSVAVHSEVTIARNRY
ncbi:MAG: rod shape-determining protein RodA [Sphingomonadales bacterium]|jgi:rod shape determining protein RodA